MRAVCREVHARRAPDRLADSLTREATLEVAQRTLAAAASGLLFPTRPKGGLMDEAYRSARSRLRALRAQEAAEDEYVEE